MVDSTRQQVASDGKGRLVQSARGSAPHACRSLLRLFIERTTSVILLVPNVVSTDLQSFSERQRNLQTLSKAELGLLRTITVNTSTKPYRFLPVCYASSTFHHGSLFPSSS
ncbi:hypothetical protein N7G274_003285 [Stereocaulon virgatum]|uniref:Uncharacterized protein n=1 Tax=Stereocaulon virgatum TaxID=373712 RepID=A0ABR4AE71_9LECA